jgi:hypothetical protein
MNSQLFRFQAGGLDLKEDDNQEQVSRSSRPWLQVVQKITDHVHSHMNRGAFPFSDSMVAVWIGHVIEWFAKFHQTINQTFDDFQMCVGFSRAMDNQKISLKPLRIINSSGLSVTLGIRFSVSGTQTSPL